MSSKQASYKVRSQKKFTHSSENSPKKLGRAGRRTCGDACAKWEWSVRIGGRGVMGSLSLQPATAYVGGSLLPDSSVWLTVLPERGWAGMDDEYGDGPDVGRLSLGHSCIVLTDLVLLSGNKQSVRD
ncbi:uncharacterized protein MCYG_05304 [Microsporum canis CBS 113480]|uniref:Uncharacterized protein n=1 Tax=Arthroderma otae (strain ATCC MYA-4605 / CBS 113480) TaxID=554155 RepID=C5FRI2_ARTOC|nr:uncharacterized protein MCYG_05304 [Microsporum canis CBS 113480]EEQ32485.1 predicted protein [Microsporum canis CBS 113480]